MTTNFDRLRAHILPLSTSQYWSIARQEWTLASICVSQYPESCPCGQNPIYEICTIRNMVNGNETDVGNICVNRFVGIESGTVFDCLRRVRADTARPLGASAIEFFHRSGALSEWEAQFCADTLRKRRLSDKQLETRRKVNCKILRAARERQFHD